MRLYAWQAELITVINFCQEVLSFTQSTVEIEEVPGWKLSIEFNWATLIDVRWVDKMAFLEAAMSDMKVRSRWSQLPQKVP